MKLLLTTTGTAQLFDDAEKLMWSSDADNEFKDQFQDEFLSEDDVEEIFDYLTDQGIVEDEDVEDIEVFEDSLVGPGDDEDDEDDEEAELAEDDEDLF